MSEKQEIPMPREFVEELRERLLSIAERPEMKRAHTHFGGEIRRLSTLVEIAANCLGRPMEAPSSEPPPIGAAGNAEAALSATDRP